MASLSKGWATLLAVCFGLSGFVPSYAEEPTAQTPGVTDTDIVIGSCVALTGALQERGREVTLGANTYLHYINDKGGINGRKVKLATCDDGYDSEKAIQCFNGCLKDKVFAGAFFVGSAPISKYVRLGDVHRMPLFGFCTGTPIIYEGHAHEFVLRAGYADEVQRMVDELINRGITKFAVIYQNDAFGAAIRESTIKALQSRHLRLASEASYARNSGVAEAEAAYKTVRSANPEAVILGATSSSLTNVIKKRDEEKWTALFATVSVADDYLSELGKAADGVILTQVTPPLDEHLPAVALYNKLRLRYKPGSKLTATGFESFLNAIVMTEALKRAGRDLTREKFVKAMESIHDLDLGAGSSFKVSFTAQDHRGFAPTSIYFTVVHDGQITNMKDSDWKRLGKVARTKTTL